jgi:hypothetical protein
LSASKWRATPGTIEFLTAWLKFCDTGDNAGVLSDQHGLCSNIVFWSASRGTSDIMLNHLRVALSVYEYDGPEPFEDSETELTTQNPERIAFCNKVIDDYYYGEEDFCCDF